jgi:hypothetical protein
MRVVLLGVGLFACGPAAEPPAVKPSTTTRPSASVVATTTATTAPPVATNTPPEPPPVNDAQAILEYVLGGAITGAWRSDNVTFIKVESHQGQFAWNGTAFVSTPLPTRAQLVDTSDGIGMIFGDLAHDSTSSRPVKVWLAPDAFTRFALFAHSFPAAQTTLVPHTNAAWMSERAVNVTEVWAANPGSFKRVLRLMTSLDTLAEPNVIVDLPVEADGVELRVGAAMTTCAANLSYTGGDVGRMTLDRSITARICANRGRYHWDGKSFSLVK